MAEAVIPYGDADRKLMWRVLAEWAKTTTQTSSILARQLRTEFKSARADALEHRMHNASPPLTLETSVWIVGQALTKEAQVFPVVIFEAFGSKSAVEEAVFRVGLIRTLEGGRVAEGWRFEQGEAAIDGEMASHPYAHAQAIMGWRKDVNCLIHPPHPVEVQCTGIDGDTDQLLAPERERAKDATLDKHPAFPLGVVTLTGLSLAVFATLYGAIEARKTFAEFHPLKASGDRLREDLVRLRILDSL